MCTKRKHIAIFSGIAIVVVLLPFVLNKLVLTQNISYYLENTLGVDTKAFVGIILDYMSILLNLALSAVVFWQVERINSLQTKKAFLYVEDLDYSFGYEGTNLTVDKTNEEYTLAHVFTSDKKAILTHINIGKGQGKPLFLPLRFITSNQQLVVSLSLTNIKILAKERSKILCNKTCFIESDAIEIVLADRDQFVVGFGMVVPQESHIDELQLAFVLVLENQDSTTQKLQINITLLRAPSDTDFIIASNRLKCLK